MAAVYSLKAARALAAVPDPQKTRFVVGSLSLREENQARRGLWERCVRRAACVAPPALPPRVG